MRAFFRSVAVLVSVVGASATVFADPILITGGYATAGSDPSSSGLFGPGTQLIFESIGSAGPTLLYPGDVVLFSANVYATSVYGYPSTNTSVNGTSYGDVFLSGGLTFTAKAPFVVPAVSPGTYLDVRDVLGDVSGHFDGFATSARTGPPLFSVDIVGRADFSESFTAVPAGDPSQRAFWFSQGEVGPALTFLPAEPGGSPTPEPASLLLLGTGLVGVVARRRRGAA